MKKSRKSNKRLGKKRIAIPEPDTAIAGQSQGAEEPIQRISLGDLVWALPLFEDDLYLSMQGQNVMLVDFYLRDLERDLLIELIRRERTPTDRAIFVSALSQMWIFGAYELLRTWRQRVRDLKTEAAKPVDPLTPKCDEDKADIAERIRLEQLSRVRTDPNYVTALDEAAARIEPVFRRIESLRMNLAKHEVPRRKGQPAMAPGYGRISYEDGSLYWMVDLGDREVDMVSRRALADGLRQAVIGQNIEAN